MRERESEETRGVSGVTASREPPGKEPGELTKPARQSGGGRMRGKSHYLKLQYVVAYMLFSLLAINTLGTLAAVYLVGFGLMALSNTVLLALIGETLAHVGAMFFTVTRFLFPTDKK
jgi:hypothetical protein